MRCTICKEVRRYANTATRTRRMCGNCLRSSLKCLKMAPVMINNG